MRVRTLEIRWHDSKPISTCDFQPVSVKKARPATERAYASQNYRLATGGEDNHVRLWLVHPNILPPSVIANAATSATEAPPAPRAPRVEYLATLSRHSAAVNVVRFSPNGELLASAGDDGMIIIWAPSSTPHSSLYGSDISAEEQQYEKEYWKPRITFRCTTMQVYDLAWSPTGEYIIAGSTDNCARIFGSNDGKCMHEIAEHNHYVQGVAWDPLNEYIATQSSDRSMHIYSISTKHGAFEVHAVGKNTRMPHHHTRTPSSQGRTPSRTRPQMHRQQSVTSETESTITSASEQLTELNVAMSPLITSSNPGANQGPLTPSTSVASTPRVEAAMFPPPMEKATSSSRRSSFSAPGSPVHPGRYGRSPSPMPALPAIRALPSSVGTWASMKLYGDESFTNFFRRLTFSPDGGLLLTPAGQFEDPSVVVAAAKKGDGESTRGRKGAGKSSTSGNGSEGVNPASASSVFIYSRANFARPPIAQLPGHKKASVAVKFSPILYELRQGVAGAESSTEPKTVVLEKGKEETVPVDVVGHDSTPASGLGLRMETASPIGPPQTPTHAAMPSPALSAADSVVPSTPSRSKLLSPAIPPTSTGSVFALPYRMLFAVATMDTVTIHDTQQAGPLCLLTKLHYDEFTDMSWSPDGQCLVMSSRDGYCTLAIFDEILPAHHTQQQAIQLQQIAQAHSVPLTTSATVSTPLSTPSVTTTNLPSLTPSLSTTGLPAMTPTPIATPTVPTKRSEPPLTPVAVDDTLSAGPSQVPATTTNDKAEKEPPKKKRRVALTRVGDLNS